MKKLNYFNSITLLCKRLESELYLTFDSKILKLTSDLEEFEVAKILLKKKNKHFADIYEIYEFYTSEVYKYGILIEKIEPISSEIENKFNLLSVFFQNNIPDYIGTPIDEFRSNNRNEIRKLLFDKSEIKHLCFYEELLSIFIEAEGLGIEISDFHLGNIGLKNGTLAMFDIK